MLTTSKDGTRTSRAASSCPLRFRQPETAMWGPLRHCGPGPLNASSPLAQHKPTYYERPRIGGRATAVANGITVGNEATPLTSRLGGFGLQPTGSRIPVSTSSREARTRATGEIETQTDRYSIGIEAKFQLRRLDERPPANVYEHFTQAGARLETVKEFLGSVVALHRATHVYPGLRMTLEKSKQDWWPGNWTIAEEPQLMRNIYRWEPNKFWGIEMTSPKLRTSPEANWQNQVKQTWSFLENNYEISKSLLCSTHIHISMECRTESRRTRLQNLRKIAQCVIHFEAAIEACAPEERRGNRNAKSNWIDNSNFVNEELTRRRVIDMIGKCAGEVELIELMCPGDRNFAWNFQALRKHGTIEFRKGAASLEGDQAIAWAQLVLQFVQCAVDVPQSSWKRIPANVRGLKAFLGLETHGLLDPILKGLEEEDSLQPEIVIACANQAEMELLERKLDFDMLEHLKLTKMEER